ncbi:MAG: anthranilate phosphoribosyltransferase [Rickettsiales bacterium]|nr:anthranilate phosphoribosyltransferase [Rickettsiales bacterium]
MSELYHYTEKLLAHQNLHEQDVGRAFQVIMSGGANPCEIASFLTALRMKGETIDEIAGAAKILRGKAQQIQAPDDAIDTCGTGGDMVGTFNISTAVAIVAAACGQVVAKHGNKAVSSKSGSADIFSHLGVNIDMTPNEVEQCLNKVGICFMMASKFHTAMRHVAPVRQEMRIRTIFNLIGPLSSPASIKRQLLGVYDAKWTEPFAHVLNKLGSQKAWIVNGSDGLDEITITGVTQVTELNQGEVRSFEISPEDVGFETAAIEEIKGGDVRYNAQQMLRVFDGKQGAHRDIIVLNAAAALLVGDKVSSLKEGVDCAAAAIDDKKALSKLDQLVSFTNSITHNHIKAGV